MLVIEVSVLFRVVITALSFLARKNRDLRWRCKTKRLANLDQVKRVDIKDLLVGVRVVSMKICTETSPRGLVEWITLV